MTALEKWTLAITAASAAGTLAAVIVAIWGDALRSLVASPRLSVRLLDPEGELTQQNDGRKVRYYHLEVSNSRRWASARNVMVYLRALDVEAPDGGWRPAVVSGPVPLAWQFGMTASLVGHPRTCDLARVVENGDFQLTTLFRPNALPSVLTGPGRLRCLVVAVADNSESEACIVECSWDGQWADGSKEMATHLVIKELS